MLKKNDNVYVWLKKIYFFIILYEKFRFVCVYMVIEYMYIYVYNVERGRGERGRGIKYILYVIRFGFNF